MKTEKKMSKLLIILIMAAVSLVLTVGCIGIVYHNGVKQFTSGSFDEARNTFQKISFLSKAKTYLNYIDVMEKNNIVSDELLQFLAEEGSTKEAQLKFTTYVDAIANFNSGKYEKSMELFEQVADFMMADEYLDMLDGIEAFRKKDYETFRNILDLVEYEEGSYLYKIREGYYAYIEAEEALDEKEYYQAYKLFKKAEGIEDSAARLKDCSMEMSTSTISYDKGITSHEVGLTFIADELQDRLVRVYNADGNKVIEMYIVKNESISYNIDEGYYTIEFACGDYYFGDRDLFGEDVGEYYRVVIESLDSYYYTAGFNYRIKLSKTDKSMIRFEPITMEEFKK